MLPRSSNAPALQERQLFFLIDNNNMNNLVWTAIQVVVALSILTILNRISVRVLKNEDILPEPEKKVSIPLMKGYVDMASFARKQFNTQNMFAKNFKNVPKSVNIMGGSQFTYSMWIRMNDPSATNVSNKTLFLRGDVKEYPYKVVKNGAETAKTERLIKCPSIKFGNTSGDLIVDFNTTTNISETFTVSKESTADEAIRHNVFSLLPGKWVLLTFVFEDNKVVQEHESGIEVKFYVNDVLYQSQRFKGSLRINNGNIHMLPDGGISGAYLAEFTYHNYALGPLDVRALYNKGFTNKRFNEFENDPDFHKPLFLSEYNKLEIHNL
jgi:hypothetical protein